MLQALAFLEPLAAAFIERVVGSVAREIAAGILPTSISVATRAWVADAADYALRELTGKAISYWRHNTTEFEASVAAALQQRPNAINEMVSAVFSNPAFILSVLAAKDAIISEADPPLGRTLREIVFTPIPEHEGIFDWAKRIGTELGMSPSEVIRLRRAAI
jgi:hypothetical protein